MNKRLTFGKFYIEFGSTEQQNQPTLNLNVELNLSFTTAKTLQKISKFFSPQPAPRVVIPVVKEREFFWERKTFPVKVVNKTVVNKTS